MSPAEREALRGFVIDVIRVEVANAIKAIDLESLRGAPGLDGKDGAPGERGEMGPAGERGEKGLDGSNGIDGKDGAPGLDGKDGADGLSIKGDPGEKGLDGKDGRDGLHGKDGKDGRDGITKDELKAGLEEMLTKSLPDAVRLAVDDAISEIPIVTYKGVFLAGESYVPGNTVTFGGSLWHCNVPTKERPDTNGDWTLAVKKGRDFRPPDRKPNDRKAG